MLGKTLGVPLVPGTGDARRDRMRRLHAERGRPAAPRDGDLQAHRRRLAVPRQADRRHGRERLRRRRSPRGPSRSSKASAPMAFRRATRPPSRCIAYASSWMKCHHPDVFLRRDPQCAADGLLRPGAARARRAPARRRGAPGRCQRLALGLHAGADRSRRASCRAPRPAPGARPREQGRRRDRRRPRRQALRQHRRAVAARRRADCRAGAAGRCRCLPALARAGAPRRGLGDPGTARPAPAAVRGGRDARRNPDCGGVRTRRRAAADDGRARGRRGLQRDRADPAAASGVASCAAILRPGASSRAPRPLRRATEGGSRHRGLVLVRQRPGSAKGVMFITIEDETGIANIVVWPICSKSSAGSSCPPA